MLITAIVAAIVHGRGNEGPTRTVAVLMNQAACLTGRSGAGSAPPTVSGQVVVWRGTRVDAATMRKLGSARSFPALGARVAITGAGRAAVCAHYTDAAERAFAAFRSAYG